MNKRRLLKLADLLEADAKNRKGIKFSLYTVGEAAPSVDEVVKVDCGTQACAMGLAAISGTFKRAGLGYALVNTDNITLVITTINGRVRDYDDAAVKVFDLTHDQAHFLFTPGFYPFGMDMTGAKAERFVAKRIRDLVAGKVEA